MPSNTHASLACELWTNYGNALDSVGRCIEAIDAYDIALKINPEMGMALGNKAVALIHIAPFMQSHRHRFYLEAIRLLNKATQLPLPPETRSGFASKLKWLNEIVEAHEEMLPEDIESLIPTNSFHTFLCEYSAQYKLFLNPVNLLGEEGKAFYGDPMFINRMNVPLSEKDRADRYTTFLNEIKQDYILGRFSLVQSQRQSEDLDTVDEGVMLVYPLDYSLQSIYIQLLKSAMKQAISVLDKVAFFIYDYCKLQTPPSNRVAFRQLFEKNDKMRSGLATLQNPYLFALFSLSREVAKNGIWGSIYDHRDALTHRFLVLHDMQLTDQPNEDIPREQEVAFTNKVILATQIARAAVMYLILFVALEEDRDSSKITGITPTIYATRLDNGFRHRPRHSGTDTKPNTKGAP